MILNPDSHKKAQEVIALFSSRDKFEKTNQTDTSLNENSKI